MVMSQIRAIIQAISDVAVATDSQTPVVYSLENAVDSVKGTPARVVFAFQTGENEGRDQGFITLGNRMSITWYIADLMLYKPSKRGTTLQSAVPELVSYVGNYALAFQNYRKLGLKLVTVEAIQHEWNEYIFPENSDNRYYGVLMTLSVKEIIE